MNPGFISLSCIYPGIQGLGVLPTIRQTLRGVKSRLFKQFTFSFWLWILLLNHLICPKLDSEFLNGPFQEIMQSTAISTLQWRGRLSKNLGPIYAICTPLYAILRHPHCSYESGIIKYTVWATCKKNFSVLAQTV